MDTEEDSMDNGDNQVDDAPIVLPIRRYTARGINPSDDPSVVCEILVANKDRIVVDEKLLPATNAIWEQLKKEHRIQKSVKALHSFASCNKHGIKYKLGLEVQPIAFESPCNNFVIDHELCADVTDDQESDGNEPNQFNDEEHHSTHKIYFCKEKWAIIKPKEVEYQRLDESFRRKKTREYTVLEPGVWTDIFVIEIEKLKPDWFCTWSFKRNRVAQTEDAEFWIRVEGKCACGCKLLATCSNPPPTDEKGVTFDVKIWGDGTSKEDHDNIRRRQLSGQRRRDIANEMIDKNLTAAFVRRGMASTDMNVFNVVPSHIPSQAVLRKNKSLALMQKRLDRDPIVSLNLLKYSNVYRFSIHDIGYDPFFVHFWTPEQLRVYNAYATAKYSRIAIDATGNIVKKIQRPSGNYSGHLFLYLGVVNFRQGEEGQAPVFQMLSERHNANGITFWLSEWVRSGGRIPNEIVTDDSKALLYAVSRAFAGCSSTSEYVDQCLEFLQGNESRRPSCLIRLDVAHFTSMICKRKEIKALKRRPREFYVRAIVQAAKAHSLEEAQNILEAIFVVALSETEGISKSTGQKTPCEIKKKDLKKLISGEAQNSVEDPQDVDADCAVQRNDDDELADLNDVSDQQSPTMHRWVNDVYFNCIRNLVDDGDGDNLMYDPDVAKRIKALCFFLPLWCAALARKMESPYCVGVSAAVEGEISNLKNRLILSQERVDDFVRHFCDIVNGSVKLASAPPTFSQANDTEATSDVCTAEIDQTITNIQAETAAQGSNDNNGYPIEISLVEENPVSESIIVEDTLVKSCIACNNGDMPTGAHSCSRCGTYVHVFEGCSFPDDSSEEGYGQNRICTVCAQKDKTATNSSRAVDPEIENSINFPASKFCDKDEVQETMCLACKNGHMPGGAHTCSCCGKNVHIFDGCSIADPTSEEGYGQKRICMKCDKKNQIAGSGEITKPQRLPIRKKVRFDLPEPTESPDLRFDKETVEEPNKKASGKNDTACAGSERQSEMQSCENWRGQAVPRRKRKPSFYWTPNPDFPALSDTSQKTKLGLLLNGSLLKLKPPKVGKEYISLTNTCPFDAPCQIIASAYSDSPAFQKYIDDSDITDSIFTVAIQLATKGVQAAAYKLRAAVLKASLPPGILEEGVRMFDCLMDSSVMKRAVSKLPMIIEKKTCSSKFCPERSSTRTVAVQSASADIIKKRGISALQQAFDEITHPQQTTCCKTLPEKRSSAMPTRKKICTPASKKHDLCTGKVTTKAEIPGHMFIEIYGAEERRSTAGGDVGCSEQVFCSLSEIPKCMNILTKQYFLRVVHFRELTLDNDKDGHYIAYCRRPDGSWEEYDDFQTKVKKVTDDKEINLHLLLYTI